MFNTKNAVDITDVPVSWVFEHYCALPEKLEGQDLMIHSRFDDGDRVPSMSIFYSQKFNRYKFKDFSTGRYGDHIDLVRQLRHLDYYQACADIAIAYQEHIATNGRSHEPPELRQHGRYKVSSHNLRGWNTGDPEFWLPFNIGSRVLGEYYVQPLDHYVMTRVVDNVPLSITITGNYLYGYFQKDGTLAKIYQPRNPDRKFIKVTDYIQGTEQLRRRRYMLIPSSLKDIMALKSLGISIDMVAPDSENVMIPDWLVQTYLQDYEKVLLLFDNDDAGIKAMKKYKEMYPAIEPCLLPMSKDPSDSIRDFGPREVRNRIIPILDRKLSGIAEL